jgi:hypothetical protein
MIFARAVLAVSALMFGGHGALCLFDPETIARESGLALPTPGASTEARAMYGGLEFALGLYFTAGALRRAFTNPALTALVVVFSGLAVARLVGLLLQPETDAYNVRALAYEGASLALGLAALLVARRSARSV